MNQKPHPSLLAVPGLFWVCAFVLPLVMVLVRGLGSGTAGTVPFNLRYAGSVFQFTLLQAAISTLCSLLVGLPGAALVALYRFPGRRILRSLSTVPFVLPPILVVLGFVLVFGSNGVINSLIRSLAGEQSTGLQVLYSFRAIIMAHVFYNFPITLRIVGNAWSQLDPAPARAARCSGSGPWQCFLSIDLPRLVPAVLTAALLTFIYCFMSFAIVLVLGGRPDLVTVEVEIYRRVNQQLDIAGGSILALAEFMVILVLLVPILVLGSRLSQDTGTRGLEREPGKLQGTATGLALLYMAVSLLFILGPLLAVAAGSLLTRSTRTATPGLSLIHWKTLADNGGRALGPVLRSLVLGTGAAIVSASTAASAAWYASRARQNLSRLIDLAMALPLAASSIVLGLGYLLLAIQFFPGKNGRILALMLVHASLSLPFSYRILSLHLNGISWRIRHSSRSLGAGPIRHFFRIELPLVRPAFLTALLFSLALSAGETSAALVLSPTGFTTVPLAIYRMVGNYRVFAACVPGTLLVLVCTLTFLVLDKEPGRYSGHKSA